METIYGSITLGDKTYQATMVGYSDYEKEYGGIILDKDKETEKIYTSEKVVGTEQAPL